MHGETTRPANHWTYPLAILKEGNKHLEMAILYPMIELISQLTMHSHNLETVYILLNYFINMEIKVNCPKIFNL